jgi:uncharacterized protein YihD (DUF1040 family)
VTIQKAEQVTFDVLEILEEEGFVEDGEDNMVYAEKAFFAARVLKWIRGQVQTDPDFDLATYLTMLAHYREDMADLEFSEDEDEILYHLKEPDQEAQELVESLIRSASKTMSEKISSDPTITDKTPTNAEEIAGPTNAEVPIDS